ncbi:MAG: alpha-amylase family glycosyl hydrolase [Tenericutes bacterium]|jgi:cyclomaltodextrinase|nr:alpha-amylase family glycosyl hydrolase [Mycoplasmatota bacterium]
MSIETSRDLRNLFIYQVYVRNYSKEGTFNALRKDLNRIKDLGVDIVYLLPIHPIGEKNRKGSLGSPYSIKDYFGINKELGTLEDFKILVEEIHRLDMSIMLDIVFNHTAFDSVLANNHPEYFYKKNGEYANKVGDWWDVTDLDFSKDKTLWKYLIDVLLYWTKLGVDGYRFDVASFLPIEFLSDMRNSVLKENPKTIFLSESVHGGLCKYLRDQNFKCLSESEIYQVFDMAYDYDTHPYFEGYLKGKSSFNRYLEELLRQEEIYPDNYVKMRNLENHDYGRFAKFVNNDLDKIRQWVSLTFFSRGATLIYNGQENCDDHLPSLFDKDMVSWNGPDISGLIKALKNITSQEITSHGVYSIDNVNKDVYLGYYQYKDNLLIGLFNVGLEEGDIVINLEDGVYENLITGKPVQVRNHKLSLMKEPIIINHKI